MASRIVGSSAFGDAAKQFRLAALQGLNNVLPGICLALRVNRDNFPNVRFVIAQLPPRNSPGKGTPILEIG
jgi:hypothetical protein